MRDVAETRWGGRSKRSLSIFTLFLLYKKHYLHVKSKGNIKQERLSLKLIRLGAL